MFFRKYKTSNKMYIHQYSHFFVGDESFNEDLVDFKLHFQGS